MPKVSSQSSPKVDTLAAKDTVKVAPIPFKARYLKGFPDSAGNNVEITKVDTMPVMEAPKGLPGELFLSSQNLNNGIMLLIIIAFFFISLSFKNGFKYFIQLLNNPFSMRLRENLFEDRTINETFILTTLISNSCIIQGILMYYFLDYMNLIGNSSNIELAPPLLCIAASTGYYLFQLIFYRILGYVYGTSGQTKIWIEGYNSTQALLGIALIPIVLMLNIHAAEITTLLTIGGILYILSHILFICKGFRIFFNKIQTTLYFILYLCGVEIVPVILSLAAAISLCNLLES